MGSALEGTASNVVQVPASPSRRLRAPVSPDHIEIASFIALAGVTAASCGSNCFPLRRLRMIRWCAARWPAHGLDDATCSSPAAST